MTAVVTQIHPETETTRHLRAFAPAPSRRPVGRPSFVVIDGGRSVTGLQRQATYRRRRLAVLLALVTAVFVLWQLVPAVLGAVTTPPTALSTTSDVEISGPTYVARAGDTLWDVARALPAGGDVRDRVDRLAAVNGSASVVVGQTVTIPADMLAS